MMSRQPGFMLRQLVHALRMVGAALVGVRDRKYHDEEPVVLSPLLLGVVAGVMVAVLVVLLVTLATWAAGA